MTQTAFELPDALTSLAVVAFEVDPAARSALDDLGLAPQDLFVRLLRDQESQEARLLARRVLHGFLSRPGGSGGAIRSAVDARDADAVAEHASRVRSSLAGQVAELTAGDAETVAAVLRQRAPLSLLGGCWLDCVSQAATQPAIVVNRLLAQHFAAMGSGNLRRGVHHARRRALEARQVFLPEIDSVDFPRQAHMRPLTALHALFYLSLSRLPASFLPEVVGVQYAYHALGVDDGLLGQPPVVTEAWVREILAEYLDLTGTSPTGAADRQRLSAAIELGLALECEHVGMLAELAEWHAGLSLEAKAAAIIERHARYAGRQHRAVRVGGRRLTDLFGDPDFDVAEFVRLFRDSRQLKPMSGGEPRFIRAIKFGGPMFGIFDEGEAAVFKAWADAVAAGERPDVRLAPNRVGDEAAQARSAAITASEPADVVYRAANPADDRELFYRLVNIETFPNMLPLARRRVMETLDAAEVLFTFGSSGRYTDASFFEYSPEALLERVDRIYWDKLVNPYRPLEEIPSREQVIFGQKVFALGSLIDGTWASRVGNVGRYRRTSDAMMFGIYADEMGLGDLRKNHITLIHQVLASMGIVLPHIRDAAFIDQGELPDHLYGFSLFQTSLAMFPDSFYNEILGYNLAIEMFGLGEMRMHEMQKLRHHGFDVSYEEAHLSIDNVSSGHARQSAEIIVSYLDDVARTVGPSLVVGEWRRIWRGYAAFAYFVERPLVESVTAGERAELTI